MQERKARRRNFITAPAVLSREGNVENESAWRIRIVSENDDGRAGFRRKAEIG
jgi:hypothetical protein